MTTHSFNGFARAFGAASIFLATLAVPAIADENLVISIDTGPTHLQTELVRQFAAELETRTGGALTAEVFDSAQLYNSRDAGRAVARGDAGMTILTSPSLSRVEANLNVFDLPMLNGLSVEDRIALVDGPLGDRLSEMVGETMGVVVPGNWLLLGRVRYWSTERPLDTLADFTGLQVRIPGGAALVARLDALGATAVVMPFADTPLALQQGVVDATMGSTETMLSQNLVDTGISYAYWDEGIIGFRVPIVNADYWNGLTDDQRAIFTTAWNDIMEVQRSQTMDNEVRDQAALEEQGVTFVSATADDVVRSRDLQMAIQDELIETLGISDEIVALAAEAVE